MRQQNKTLKVYFEGFIKKRNVTKNRIKKRNYKAIFNISGNKALL